MLDKIYKDLHRIPELSFQEHETKKYIMNILEKHGIEYENLNNGLIARVKSNSDDEFIGFRCELDALDIKEYNDIDFKSNNDYMHACGHDLHMAILIGICIKVNEIKEQLNKNVLFIFQSGEEKGDGARKLILEYNFPKLTEIYSFHNSNIIKSSQLGIQKGQINSHIIDFEIKFIGKSAHVAQPYLGKDALNCAINFINNIKFNQSSTFGAHKQYLINFSNLNTVNDNNRICDNAVLSGTIRIGSLDMIEKIWSYFNTFLKTTTLNFDIDYTLKSWSLPALINNDILHDKIKSLNYDFVNYESMSSGGDDFSHFSQIAPIYLIKVGSMWQNNEYHNMPVHSNTFLPNYNCIENVVKFAIDILKK